MKIKKYEVYDMKEAMALIKKELGPDAVILSTRKIVKNGSFGLFSRPMIEVTAAVDYTAKREVKKPKENYNPAPEKNTDDSADISKITDIINSLGLNKFEMLLNDMNEIKKQISEMKTAISENIALDLPKSLQEVYNIMIKNEVDDVLSYKFLKKIENRIPENSTPLQIKNIAAQLFGDLIPTEKSYFSTLKKKVLALVGPTGVGKTTTVAKIAANLALKLQKSVALISIDTFRIGAVEQLKSYAEIIDVPLRVASSPTELNEIILDFEDYEYILLDTMGRSQYDTAQIDDLKSFLTTNPLINVALVLSMSSNHSELGDTFNRYSKLSPDYLIFTKLDETRYFGTLASLPILKKVPILLMTNGQNVPEDMEIPDGKKIAKFIFNEIPNLWRS
ncbi:flagellar biosynthesis protein FlhF [Deferribacteraceae bacterium V6Fe1]|jgi:flagellar biosynthesis protein FlhF|nr:flagellar biosynthetic protein FlhF [Deferribacteraceae bacterium]UOD33934.1 flagellar biosynthesis protein FlhF [Deferribacteraceae bacterium V6Fe1]